MAPHYQDLYTARRGDPELAAEYEQMLQADPDNSALLYLCGRICGERTRATELSRVPARRMRAILSAVRVGVRPDVRRQLGGGQAAA